MTLFLLLIAVVVIVCILATRLSSKFGVPTLLIFILLGMVFGSDGLFKISFDDFIISEQICTFALTRGIKMNGASQEEIINATKFAKNMPEWPANDAIQKNGELIIVKMGNVK